MRRIIAAMALLLGAMASVSAQEVKLSADNIDEVISSMTLEEKVNLLHGCGMAFGTEVKFPGTAGSTFPIARLGITPAYLADGPHRLAMSQTRDFDSRQYNTTEIPSEITVAATFSEEAARKAGEILGEEVRDYGIDILLAPGINIHRTMLGGRNGEYYSEDPLLAGKIGGAYINGVQSKNIGVALKHYAVNNQETNRNANDARVSQRALREIYLKNFEIAIRESNPWSIMTSYNKVNGNYVCEDRWFCEDVLRGDWGYNGLVMSDWNAGRNPVASILAGNDMLQPGQDRQRAAILAAAKDGSLPMEYIDLSVRRVLEFVLKTNTYKGYKYANETDLKAHSKLAREIGAEGIVLLKNSAATLPLARTARLALYGTTSYDIVPAGMGFGATGHGYYCVSLVEGLRNAGIAIDKSLIAPYKAHIAAENRKNYPNGMPPFSITAPARADEFIPEPAMLEAGVKANDMAVITIGRACGEGADRLREHFALTQKESELIDKVSAAYHAAGKKVVVLMNVVSATETASWKDKVDAILCIFQPGAETGNAVADVLTGKVNPSGRLPQTFQIAYGDAWADSNFPADYHFDMSAFSRAYSGGSAKDAAERAQKAAEPVLVKDVDYTDYEEGIYVGYRYFDTYGKPVSYPFGYGLSYTSFSYEVKGAGQSGDRTYVDVEVTNTGKVAGKEVVQVYVKAPKSKIDKPAKELRAFGKTGELAPGASQTLRLEWLTSDMSSWNEKKSCWQLDKGEYQILVCRNASEVAGNTSIKIK